MSDRALQHRRVHNLLLIQKLLASRDASSPFTLVLDSVEQSAGPLVRHYIHHAKVCLMSSIIYLFVYFCSFLFVRALAEGGGLGVEDGCGFCFV